MKYTYDKDNLKKWLLKNIDILLESPTFQALIVEVKVADDAGSEFVDQTGHDEVGSRGRIETKFTNYVKPDGTLRINKAGKNKENGFDIIRIIDGINQRIFEIPHDIFYGEAKIYPSGEFLWSCSYNKTDSKQSKNTQLLLKYEVTE